MTSLKKLENKIPKKRVRCNCGIIADIRKDKSNGEYFYICPENEEGFGCDFIQYVNSNQNKKCKKQFTSFKKEKNNNNRTKTFFRVNIEIEQDNKKEKDDDDINNEKNNQINEEKDFYSYYDHHDNDFLHNDCKNKEEKVLISFDNNNNNNNDLSLMTLNHEKKLENDNKEKKSLMKNIEPKNKCNVKKIDVHLILKDINETNVYVCIIDPLHDSFYQILFEIGHAFSLKKSIYYLEIKNAKYILKETLEWIIYMSLKSPRYLKHIYDLKNEIIVMDDNEDTLKNIKWNNLQQYEQYLYQNLY